MSVYPVIALLLVSHFAIVSGSRDYKKLETIAYVNVLQNWWGDTIIEESFGLNSCYDSVILTFWLSTQGAYDALKVYETIYDKINTDKYGVSNAEV